MRAQYTLLEDNYERLGYEIINNKDGIKFRFLIFDAKYYTLDETAILQLGYDLYHSNLKISINNAIFPSYRSYFYRSNKEEYQSFFTELQTYILDKLDKQDKNASLFSSFISTQTPEDLALKLSQQVDKNILLKAIKQKFHKITGTAYKTQDNLDLMLRNQSKYHINTFNCILSLISSISVIKYCGTLCINPIITILLIAFTHLSIAYIFNDIHHKDITWQQKFLPLYLLNITEKIRIYRLTSNQTAKVREFHEQSKHALYCNRYFQGPIKIENISYNIRYKPHYQILMRHFALQYINNAQIELSNLLTELPSYSQAIQSHLQTIPVKILYINFIKHNDINKTHCIKFTTSQSDTSILGHIRWLLNIIAKQSLEDISLLPYHFFIPRCDHNICYSKGIADFCFKTIIQNAGLVIPALSFEKQEIYNIAVAQDYNALRIKLLNTMSTEPNQFHIGAYHDNIEEWCRMSSNQSSQHLTIP